MLVYLLHSQYFYAVPVLYIILVIRVMTGFLYTCFSICLPYICFNYAAAVVVAKKEAWRRTALRKRVNEFRALTGIPIESHIISLVVGSEDRALQASRLPPLSLSLCISPSSPLSDSTPNSFTFYFHEIGIF